MDRWKTGNQKSSLNLSTQVSKLKALNVFIYNVFSLFSPTLQQKLVLAVTKQQRQLQDNLTTGVLISPIPMQLMLYIASLEIILTSGISLDPSARGPSRFRQLRQVLPFLAMEGVSGDCKHNKHYFDNFRTFM